MGWIDSLPFFCGVTETARDVMEDYDRVEAIFATT
jgi:hypothetical protein